MGEVYRARDTRLDRPVAVKVLPEEWSRSATLRKRLDREARTISQLQHPHVCTLFDLGSEKGVDYLVMEYLEGETLEERLREGALPLEDVVRIGGEIADAIEAAHRRGLVHRDLKPGNVMLTDTGAKVLDFGLAREGVGPAVGVETQAATVEAITSEGSLVGTIPYMAPEQLRRSPVDSRTDIWALGCILFEMTTGDRAFHGEKSGRPHHCDHGIRSGSTWRQPITDSRTARRDREAVSREEPGGSVAVCSQSLSRASRGPRLRCRGFATRENSSDGVAMVCRRRRRAPSSDWGPGLVATSAA